MLSGRRRHAVLVGGRDSTAGTAGGPVAHCAVHGLPGLPGRSREPAPGRLTTQANGQARGSAVDDEAVCLIGEVRRVFTEVGVPQGPLFVALEEGSPIAEALQDVFEGRPWGDFSAQELHRNSDALYWFLNEPWGYYLPALLIGALCSVGNASSEFDERFFGSFMPGYRAREALRERLRVLTVEQRQVLLSVLCYLQRVYNDPESALWLVCSVEEELLEFEKAGKLAVDEHQQ